MHPDEVSIHDMKQALDNAALGIKVVDIREPGEYAAAHIAGVMFVPMSEMQLRLDELDP